MDAGLTAVLIVGALAIGFLIGGAFGIEHSEKTRPNRRSGKDRRAK